MRFSKSLELAWNLIAHSKLRSWLTIIGIVIGIAAVVSIISVSQGAQQALTSRFGQLGADIITISPGYSRAGGFMGPEGEGGNGGSVNQKNLTNKDILALKSVPNVKFVMGTVSARGAVKYLDKSGNANVLGVDTSVWKDIVTTQLDSGRYLTKSDLYSTVLGYGRANTYFGKPVQLNRQITIEGKLFKVVGIFAESGGGTDNSVIIPIEAARDVLSDVGSKEFDSITVKVDDINQINQTITDIVNKLMMSRGILKATDRDFSVSSVLEMQQTIASTLNTMAIFLGAIAAISLIVGGIGISNTMFTSVLEKTKEIGVMKAIGAKNRDILMIFLFSSGMIGFIGGLGGVILGSVASGYISLLASGGTAAGPGGFGRIFSSAALSPQLLIFAFSFSIIIGIIAGAIPAYRASRLKPVDALRYE